jgi:iron complex transport system permease protein
VRQLLLAAAVVAAFVLSLLAGKVWVPPAEFGTGSDAGWILAELRLPRALLGLAIGAGLGLSGAVMQGYLRNPLADPSILGISASAALGAVIALSLGGDVSPALLFVSAFAGAGGAVVLLLVLSRGDASPVTFVLAGTVLSSLAGALTAFLVSVAPNPFATAELVTWLSGALTDRSIDDAWRALPPVVLGCALLALAARDLDALSLGEDGAASLGVDLGRLRLLVVAGLCLTVGSAVAVSGVVGFVGLIVPHVVRALVGARPSAVLLPSAMAGAVLVLVADSLVRLVPGPGEIRLGVVTALIGAPFFFVLLLRIKDRIA